MKLKIFISLLILVLGMSIGAAYTGTVEEGYSYLIGHWQSRDGYRSYLSMGQWGKMNFNIRHVEITDDKVIITISPFNRYMDTITFNRDNKNYFILKNEQTGYIMDYSRIQ